MTYGINPKLLDVVEFADPTSKEKLHGTVVEWIGGAPETVLVEVSNEQGVPIAFTPRVIQDFDRLCEITPSARKEVAVSEAQRYFENGVLFLQNGLVARAKDQFSRSFSIDQQFRGMLLNMTNELGKKGAFDTAIFLYTLLLELAPQYENARENLAVTFLNRGVAHARAGLIEQAINEFIQALMLNPSQRTVEAIRRNIVASYTQLGIFHTSSKQYQLAFQWFQFAFELDPSELSRKNLALAMVAVSTTKTEDRSRENISEIFRQPLMMGLHLSECLTAYGATVAGFGDLSEARWAFESAIDSDPANSVAKHNLEVLSESGPTEEIAPGITPVEILSVSQYA